jgi:hypothetical protein
MKECLSSPSAPNVTLVATLKQHPFDCTQTVIDSLPDIATNSVELVAGLS